MVTFPEQMYILSLFPCLTHFVTMTGVWLWSRGENILFFLMLHFSELCLGSAGFRAVGQRLSGPQDSTPIAGLGEWWLLTHSGLSAACSVEPLARVQPRKISKRELALHAVTIGGKCKCGHLCKLNPPEHIASCFLQSFLPFALFPRAPRRKMPGPSLCVATTLSHLKICHAWPFLNSKTLGPVFPSVGLWNSCLNRKVQTQAEMTTQVILKTFRGICASHCSCSASRIAARLTLLFRHFQLGFLSTCLWHWTLFGFRAVFHWSIPSSQGFCSPFLLCCCLGTSVMPIGVL